MRFRTYTELDGSDNSGLPEQIAAQTRRVSERLAHVRSVLAVTSGKGGVGKSAITAALAESLADREWQVGVLDADLRSPTVARLLCAEGPVRVRGDCVEPARARHGIRVMSTDLLLAESDPLAWSGASAASHLSHAALERGVLREFLADVDWGHLDLLLLDLAPGADLGGELQWLIPRLSGVVVVTIPSAESRRSVARTLRAALAAGVRVLGVVENMSGYRCVECGTTQSLFSGTAGKDLAEEFAIPLLAEIPFVARGAPIDRSDVAGSLLRVVEETVT